MIKYRAGYKYQLAKGYSLQISLKPQKRIYTFYIGLTKEGKLAIRNGYAWDGPSGPVIDSSHNIRASLVHDALYQLMRQGYLKNRRQKADRIFEELCIEDGVPKMLARAYYFGLRAGGASSASERNRKIIFKAP